MSETSAVSVLVWWVLLLASVVLILHEMVKWLRTGTIDLGVWADTPRLEPPKEEISGVAAMFESLSKDQTGRLIIGRAVSDAVIDRVSLILQLDKSELEKLSHDEEFVKGVFGEHVNITRYFSEKWIMELFSSKSERKAVRKSGMASACLGEFRTLLEQLSRWENKYESSRGI